MVTNYNLFVLFTKSFDRFGAWGVGVLVEEVWGVARKCVRAWQTNRL